MKEIRRGQLWWVDWSPARGSEQSGRRPALVVQRNSGNLSASYPNTVVLAVSRQGRDIPFHIRIKATRQTGLRQTSFVKCEQILTISKERLAEKIGHLSLDEMKRVNEALRSVLELDLPEGDEPGYR